MRSLRQLVADRTTLAGFAVTALLLVVLLVILLTHLNLAGETEPLHYNIYFGIDLAGPGAAVLWPWFVALAISLVNLVLAAATAERDRLAGRLLAWFSVSVVALTTLGSILVLTYHP
ncbi:MAG: hypothetical protein U0514_01655 [Candidatus Andersenbacteria bacterium]